MWLRSLHRLRNVWARFAQAAGITVDELLADTSGFVLGRTLRLAEVADTAAFLASDSAGAMTATVTNLSGGIIAD